MSSELDDIKENIEIIMSNSIDSKYKDICKDAIIEMVKMLVQEIKNRDTAIDKLQQQIFFLLTK